MNLVAFLRLSNPHGDVVIMLKMHDPIFNNIPNNINDYLGNIMTSTLNIILSAVMLVEAISAILTCWCMVYMDVVAKENLCNFIASLYRDFGGFGCCVESPLVENDVCYTSTNYLAEHVLRNVCSRHDLANKIRAFLDKYPTDFYDYYQILLHKPLQLPFATIEHVQVDNVKGLRIIHVKRTSTVIKDYYSYANLVAYKALYNIINNNVSGAITELNILSSLFDGHGFADAYYETHGKYESYKVALAVILYKALGYTSEVEKYTNILMNIKPFTTLYSARNSSLIGEGDLNLETACLVAIALYSPIDVTTSLKTMTTSEIEIPAEMFLLTATIIVVSTSILITCVKNTRKKSFKAHILEKSKT